MFCGQIASGFTPTAFYKQRTQCGGAHPPFPEYKEDSLPKFLPKSATDFRNTNNNIPTFMENIPVCDLWTPFNNWVNHQESIEGEEEEVKGEEKKESKEHFADEVRWLVLFANRYDRDWIPLWTKIGDKGPAQWVIFWVEPPPHHFSKSLPKPNPNVEIVHIPVPKSCQKNAMYTLNTLNRIQEALEKYGIPSECYLSSPYETNRENLLQYEFQTLVNKHFFYSDFNPTNLSWNILSI